MWQELGPCLGREAGPVGGAWAFEGVWWCRVSGSVTAALKDPRCRWRGWGAPEPFLKFSHVCTCRPWPWSVCVIHPSPALGTPAAPQFYAPQSGDPSLPIGVTA